METGRRITLPVLDGALVDLFLSGRIRGERLFHILAEWSFDWWCLRGVCANHRTAARFHCAHNGCRSYSLSRGNSYDKDGGWNPLRNLGNSWSICIPVTGNGVRAIPDFQPEQSAYGGGDSELLTRLWAVRPKGIPAIPF